MCELGYCPYAEPYSEDVYTGSCETCPYYVPMSTEDWDAYASQVYGIDEGGFF